MLWPIQTCSFGDGFVGARAFGGSVALMCTGDSMPGNLCIVVLVNDLTIDSSNTHEVVECILRHQNLPTDVLDSVFAGM